MVNKPRWETSKPEKGVVHVRMSHWKYFSTYVHQEMLDYTEFIYRGHGSATWLLEPTIDRLIKSPNSPKRQEHLDRFKFETRGRRGSNPPLIQDDNDWWALGQHHGLATPLLDWTESPFVALYFAARSAVAAKQGSNIAVFALAEDSIQSRNTLVRNSPEVQTINKRAPTVKIVRPLSDENSRLVSQRGLFTRGPNNMDLEEWIVRFHEGTEEWDELIKITIPATGLQDCLRHLNRMNISHATLFPDLTGASDHCNQHLRISKY